MANLLIPPNSPPTYSDSELHVDHTSAGSATGTGIPLDLLNSDDEDIELETPFPFRPKERTTQPTVPTTPSTTAQDMNQQRNSLKELALKRLTPRQHFVVAMCRDVSLFMILKNCFVLWSMWYQTITSDSSNLGASWATEFLLAGIWCIVSTCLSYSMLDGFMARWMVIYTVQAAIVRILSMSLLIIVLVELLNRMFNNPQNEFCLATWILISCVLTLIYIIQNYVTSNMRLNELLLKEVSDTERESLRQRITTTSQSHHSESGDTAAPAPKPRHHIRRKVDLYNLTVYAVVPIGVASFITMVGLVRLVVILRLEIGLHNSESYNESYT